MKQLTTRFSAYELTEEEELRGSVFNFEQIAVLQNKLAEAAEAKSALKLDPNDTLPYVQQESFLSSQIEFIEFLIANSIECEETLSRVLTDTLNPED